MSKALPSADSMGTQAVYDMLAEEFRALRKEQPHDAGIHSKFANFVFSKKCLLPILGDIELTLRDAKYHVHTDNHLYGGEQSKTLPWNAVFDLLVTLAQQEPATMGLKTHTQVQDYIVRQGVPFILHSYQEDSKNKTLYANEDNADLWMATTNYRPGAPVPDAHPQLGAVDKIKDCVSMGAGIDQGITGDDLDRTRIQADAVGRIEKMRQSFTFNGQAPIAVTDKGQFNMASYVY
jgi:hypothetical protein